MKDPALSIHVYAFVFLSQLHFSWELLGPVIDVSNLFLGSANSFPEMSPQLIQFPAVCDRVQVHALSLSGCELILQVALR